MGESLCGLHVSLSSEPRRPQANMKIVYALAKNLSFMIRLDCRGAIGRASALGDSPNDLQCPGSLANPS